MLYEQPCLSLKLDGIQVVLPEPEQTQGGEVYDLGNGLKLTRALRLFPEFHAFSQTLWLENCGAGDSALITELRDFDGVLPFGADGEAIPGWSPKEPMVHILSSKGSMCSPDDFRLMDTRLGMGGTMSFGSAGGRSCQPVAPFFDLRHGEHGYIVAPGWTGDWHCDFTRVEGGVHFLCNVQGLSFRLHAGEKIRTSQVLIMEYGSGQTAAHNQWRRLLKAHYVPSNIVNHLDDRAMLCMMFWGSLPSDEMVRRIRLAKEKKLGFDYLWIDAGWYGHSVQGCPSEFTGDWPRHTGSWNINPTYHPDEFRDVCKALDEADLKFLLWLEPERAINTTDWPTGHPEWFLTSEKDGDNVLLNLGNPDACDSCIELVSGIIEKLNLSIYRQDFNIDPKAFWDEADEPERKGLSEVHYVMGLYRFWDTLLTRFPHLIIDNCASGGRRIDVETCSRSTPMWRTDYTCVWDCDDEMNQGLQGSISYWLPYSGAGPGKVTCDPYRFLGSIGESMDVSRWGYEEDSMPESGEQAEKEYAYMREMAALYKKIVPFLSCDYYPLAKPSFEKDDWTIWQYESPEKGEGVILAFRRSECPLEKAVVTLGGLQKESEYTFTDEWSGKTAKLSGEELSRKGLAIELPEKRSCKVLFYKIGK